MTSVSPWVDINRSTPTLAFAPGRIVRLAPFGLTAWNLDRPSASPLEIPLQRATALGALADGGILALDEMSGCYLPAGSDSACPVAGPFVVDRDRLARVRGDPDDPSRFWVASRSAAAYYELREGAREPTLHAFLDIDENAHEQIVGGSKGSIFYPASYLIYRADNHGREQVCKDIIERSALILHLSGGTDGRLWATLMTIDGPPGRSTWGPPEKGSLALLDPRAEVSLALWLDFDQLVMAMDSHGGNAAVLLVTDVFDPGWTLAVFDTEGRSILRAVPPWSLTALESGRSHVVLSPWAPLVAVGDGSRLAVWDLRTGSLLMTLGV